MSQVHTPWCKVITSTKLGINFADPNGPADITITSRRLHLQIITLWMLPQDRHRLSAGTVAQHVSFVCLLYLRGRRRVTELKFCYGTAGLAVFLQHQQTCWLRKLPRLPEQVSRRDENPVKDLFISSMPCFPDINDPGQELYHIPTETCNETSTFPPQMLVCLDGPDSSTGKNWLAASTGPPGLSDLGLP